MVDRNDRDGRPDAEDEDIVLGGVRGQVTGRQGALVVEEQLPDKVFVLPLRQAVAFPGFPIPLQLDAPEMREVVAKAEAGNGHLLLLALKDPEVRDPGPDDFRATGVLVRVIRTMKLPEGSSQALTQGLRRARVSSFVKSGVLLARIEVLDDIPADGKRARALHAALQDALRRMADVSEQLDEHFSTAVLNMDRPEQLADFTGMWLIRDLDKRQKLLDALDVGERLELALQMVVEELEVAELGNRIRQEIREKVEKAQKEYFLREQLKIIRRELGEEVDAREAEMERLATAIDEAGLPEKAETRAREELGRLRTTPAESPEYGVIRNYLDWLTTLPWSRSSKDREDLKVAAKVLDEDHFGLEDVKDRILEFLAVRKLQPANAGSILCFSGPPGVGKTSLGRSIARAMNREFWRFSLGGMRDEAEIKGHRRTYIGAMPGRIMQGLKACGTNNPVLLLDEIDKLGSDFRGDPSSALLEVLDPEQNSSFLDHYVDVPFDLSRVLFLATANVLPQIPEPLRDRMEIIELPGYLVAEKVEIAMRHLLPKQIARHGLRKSDLGVSKTVMKRIVEDYTREAGVRGLEKQILRLCRKAARRIAGRRKPLGRVQVAQLPDLLGKPRRPAEGERRVRVPGVVQGLAWTPHGGDVLYIEATIVPGKGNIVLTGSLGDVMRESARIAVSYLRANAALFDLEESAFEGKDLHVHFPAGSIPKDGPSAGIAIATALLSMLLDRRAPADLAMTGELTLVGEVLPIGGVREKVLAARRLGLKRVVLPAENRSDVEELDADQVKGLRFVYVEEFVEVFAEVFAARGGRRKKAARRKAGTRKTSRKADPAARRRR